MEKYGLLGKKLIHSISPYIHGRLFALQSRDAVYELIECDSIAEFERIADEYVGYNVTIPYKEDIFALPMLTVSEQAKQYRAINCVDNVHKTSYNTDIYGFSRSVESIYPSVKGNILVVGFGGVAKVIVQKYLDSNLTIAIRNLNADKVTIIKTLLGEGVRVVDINEIGQRDKYHLIVNATPVGMYPNTQDMPIAKEIIANCDAVYDTIYNPLDTRLLIEAKRLNKPCKNGLDMLVYQAVKSHYYWYGAEFCDCDIEAIITECDELLRR